MKHLQQWFRQRLVHYLFPSIVKDQHRLNSIVKDWYYAYQLRPCDGDKGLMSQDVSNKILGTMVDEHLCKWKLV